MALSSVSLARAAVLSLGLTLLGSTIALAQTATTPPVNGSTGAAVASIPEFARELTGKDVWITADGVRVRGVVNSLSPNGLVMLSGGWPTTIAYTKVVRVEKSSHRVRNGALIGLASGAGLGLAVWCSDGVSDYCVSAPFVYAGLGAGVGAFVGYVRNGTHKKSDVLYEAPRSTTTMTFSPILSPTRKGLAFSVSWR